MDVNTALRAALRCAERIDKAQTDAERAEWGGHLSTLVGGLNDWLTQGGFLPDEWMKNRPAEAAVIPLRGSTTLR